MESPTKQNDENYLCPGTCNNFHQALSSFRDSMNLVDLNIKIGSHTFTVHRLIMALSSPVLEALISERWSAGRECVLDEEYLDAETFGDLLDFIYTRKILLKPDTIHPICSAAHYLQMDEILEICRAHLHLLLKPSNVLAIFDFSSDCEFDDFKEICFQFMVNPDMKFFQSGEILKIPFEVFYDMIEGVANRTTYCYILQEIFRATVEWTKQDIEGRSKYLKCLLDSAILKKSLSRAFLNDYLSKQDVALFERVSDLVNVRQVYWNEHDEHSRIYFFGDRGSELMSYNQCVSFDIIKNEWRQYGNTRWSNIDWRFCTYLRGKIFLDTDVTFFPSRNCTNLVTPIRVFDTIDGKWKEWSNMNVLSEGRSFAMAAHDGRLFISGCMSSRREARYFCHKTHEWISIAPMMRKRLNHSLVSLGHYIYAIGGDDEFSIERYDQYNDKWTLHCILRTRFQDGTAVQHNEHIFVSGNDYIDVYSEDPKFYQRLPKLENIYFAKVLSIHGKLVACGQPYHDSSSAMLIYEFDSYDYDWKLMKTIPFDQSRYTFVVG